MRSESCWAEMEDIDEDEDLAWGTLQPTVVSRSPGVTRVSGFSPPPSMLHQIGGTHDTVKRLGHMHTMIDSDEEPLVTLSHMPVATQVDGSALSSQSDTSQSSLIRSRRVGRMPDNSRAPQLRTILDRWIWPSQNGHQTPVERVVF